MIEAGPELIRWGWFFLSFYIALMMVCGVIGMRRVRSGDDFATARAGYGPWFLSFALVATTASGGTFLGLPGIAYKDGLAGLWYAFIYPFGVYTGIVLCARVVRRAGDTFGNRSIPEYLGDRFQSDFLRIAASIYSLLLLFYLAAQLLSGAIMFNKMLDVDFTPALYVTAGILLLYITLGGAHADILTDGVQGALMLLIAGIVVVLFAVGYGVGDGAGVSGVVERIRELDADDVRLLNPTSAIVGSWWGIFAIWFAHIPLGMLPHIGNKLWALRDTRQQRRFLTISFVIGVLMPSLALGGLLARAVLGDQLFAPGESPNYSIPALFVAVLPPWIAAFLGMGMLAAVMSTADGLAVAVSQIFANDLFRRTHAPKMNLSDAQVDRAALHISRIATALVMGVCMAMAAYFHTQKTNIAIIIWLGIGGMTAALTGPFLLGAIWRGVSRTGAHVGFFTGAGIFLLMSLASAFEVDLGAFLNRQCANPFVRATIGGMASALVTVLISRHTPLPPAAHLDRMFGKAKGAG